MSINKKIEEIKAFVKQRPWFEFELISYDKSRLLIGGSRDIHAFYEIYITFEEVFMIHNLEWAANTSSEIIQLVIDQAAKEINIANQIEQGYQLFEFIPDGVSENVHFYISALKIDYEVIIT